MGFLLLLLLLHLLLFLQIEIIHIISFPQKLYFLTSWNVIRFFEIIYYIIIPPVLKILIIIRKFINRYIVSVLFSWGESSNIVIQMRIIPEIIFVCLISLVNLLPWSELRFQHFISDNRWAHFFIFFIKFFPICSSNQPRRKIKF